MNAHAPPPPPSPERPSLRGPVVVAVVCAAAVALAFVLPPSAGEERGMTQFLGRFHILALHLPIGALVVTLVIEGLGIVSGERARERASVALDVLVPFLFASATLAFVLGVLLAYGGGHPPHLLALHRGTTLAGLVACAATAIAFRRASRNVFRALLALTAALLSIGAHFGGSLTHGEDYLVRFAPGLGGEKAAREATKVEPPDAGVASDPTVFADVVMPVLREHCVECHGPEKSKGRLRLDSLEAIRAGGKNGPVVVARDSAKSPLVTRMRLPIGDDERMPPEDKKAPTKDQIDLVAFWIDRGADPDLRVRDLLVPEGPRKLLEQTKTSGVQAPASAPAPAPAPAPTKPEPTTTTATTVAGDTAVFASLVRPVLDAKCGSCHGRSKTKGGLRTDSLAALAAGGESGPAVVPGKPNAGTLLTRLRLPLEKKEHMPPRAQPQLSPGELALLTWWIGKGAPERASSVPAFSLAARAPTTKTTEAPPPPVPENVQGAPFQSDLRGARLFREVVAPILASKCGECHAGPDPSSGARFDDPARLLSKHHVVPGKPAESPLLARMKLPLRDPDHMPPPEAKQPTRAEIEAIASWIEGGAQIEEAPAAKAPEPTAVAEQAKAAARVEPRAGGCGACTTTGATASGDGVLAGALVVLGAFVRLRSTRSTARAPSR